MNHVYTQLTDLEDSTFLCLFSEGISTPDTGSSTSSSDSCENFKVRNKQLVI